MPIRLALLVLLAPDGFQRMPRGQTPRLQRDWPVADLGEVPSVPLISDRLDFTLPPEMLAPPDPDVAK
jgi:hypothetical protein